MRDKSLWVSLAAFVFTTGLLYVIGYLFNVDWLQFQFWQANPSKDVLFSAGGSVLPLILGLVVCLVVAGLYKRQQ